MRTIRFFAAACLSLFLLLLASGASAVEQDPYRLGAPSMTQKNMERWVAAPGTGSKIWVKRQTPFPATGWTALPYKAMKNNAAGPALTMASLTYGDDTFRLYAFITANDNKVYYTVDNVLRPNGADPSWNAWAPLPTAGLPSGTVKSVPSADFTDVSGSSIKIVVRGNDDHPYVLVGTVGA